MKRIGMLKTGRWMISALVLLTALVLAAGCRQEAVATDTTAASGNAGALDASYENALDVTSQLALGTLELADTEDAVTEEQAAILLPLWRALLGNELQADAERNAVVKQIEATMTEAQISAIAGMRLEQQNAQAWMQEQAQQVPTGLAVAPIAQARQQTSEQGTAPSTGGGTSAGLIRAVVALLARSSRQTVVGEALAASTLDPTTTPVPVQAQSDPTSSATPEPVTMQVAEPTQTPEPTPTATTTSAVTPAVTDTVASTSAATPIAAKTAASAAVTTSASTTALTPALAQVEDTDPGPPFTVIVSANTATQDPLVEKSRTYTISGIVRNDGDQTYAVSAINVTFFDADGFRGSFYRFPQPWLTGGEWVWHGKTQADFAYLLLAPGEECPFSVQITAQNMASFLIHADAVPTSRESAPVELSKVQISTDGTDYVRITGTATNSSSFKAKNVTVVGTLLDANGESVSVGSAYVLQEDIEPGASVSFDVRIAEEAFSSYRLYAQAERDWS